MIWGAFVFLVGLLALAGLAELVRWALFKPGPFTPTEVDPLVRKAEQEQREAREWEYWHIKAHGRPPKA